MGSKSVTIPWGIFSDKHKEYISKAFECDINVAEGAVRSGKTIDNCIIARDFIDFSRDRIHLASGSSIANAKMNIGDCNGFGLEHQFRGRCYWGKYKGNEALIVGAKAGERVVIFAGAAKADSFKKIRGNSYGLWIATEINIHTEEFINEARRRQIMAIHRKVLWDLNPEAPKAMIYTKYLDVYEQKAKDGTLGSSYNYVCFELYDNANITEQRRKEIEGDYEKDSVEYLRYIKGKRIQAEGIIFRAFANNPDKWITTDKPAEKDIDFISIGVDFGGNKSKSVFVATAIMKNYSGVHIIDDHKIEGQKGEIDGDIVNKEFIEFYQRVQSEYPSSNIDYGFGDSAEQYLIAGIQGAISKHHFSIAFTDCAKVEINDRIRCKKALMNTGRWHVMKHCTHVIGSTKEQLWDGKVTDKDVRLDDGTTDVDTADAEEYTWERWVKHFELARR